MTRRHWRNPHGPVEAYYGLGIISGNTADWDWFGHSGGFQGYLSRTAVIPACDLTVSILTNSIDGLAEVWLDGAMNILRVFADRGAPSRRIRDWTGRWWSTWGAIDLVPLGNRVIVANPNFINPFMAATEIEVTGRDIGRISLATGYASHGEAGAPNAQQGRHCHRYLACRRQAEAGKKSRCGDGAPVCRAQAALTEQASRPHFISACDLGPKRLARAVARIEHVAARIDHELDAARARIGRQLVEHHLGSEIRRGEIEQPVADQQLQLRIERQRSAAVRRSTRPVGRGRNPRRPADGAVEQLVGAVGPPVELARGEVDRRAGQRRRQRIAGGIAEMIGARIRIGIEARSPRRRNARSPCRSCGRIRGGTRRRQSGRRAGG